MFDSAAVEIGIVDWETLDYQVLYSGTLGRIEDNRRGFSGELRSAKHALERDLVPRTSPTCRASFCGRGCGLSATRFTTRQTIGAIDHDRNRVQFEGIAAVNYVDGQLRFLDGPQTGLTFGILGAVSDWLTLDRPVGEAVEPGIPVELREGCDHLLATCEIRFGNALNFRGEPFLPGNDLLARYGQGGG
mgnify:CR=1 FL=1